MVLPRSFLQQGREERRRGEDKEMASIDSYLKEFCSKGKQNNAVVGEGGHGLRESLLDITSKYLHGKLIFKHRV